MTKEESVAATSADVRQSDDGALVRIAVKGSFRTPPGKDVTKGSGAFLVRQSADEIVLSANPRVRSADVRTSGTGLPESIELAGAPANGADEGAKPLLIRFEWDEGQLVGVSVEGDFPHHVDTGGNKLFHPFRMLHRPEGVKLVFDRSDVRGITRIEEVDMGAGLQAKMYCPSVRSSRRAQNLMTKEPDTITWLDGVQPGSTLWDLGANVGAFTLYGAMKRECRVIAFEPAAANYQALNRNIELNGLQDRATAYCLAVARETSLDILYLQGTDFGDAFCNFGAPTDIFGGTFDASFKQGMIGMSLDDLAKSLPFPNHLKIDVDGLEKDIVLGGAAVFGDARVKSAMIELDKARPALIAEVAEIMKGHGFRLTNEGNMQDAKLVLNAIFVRPS